MRRRSSIFFSIFGAVSIASIFLYCLLQFQSYKSVLDSDASYLLENAESDERNPNPNSKDGNILRKFKRSHAQGNLDDCETSSFEISQCLRVYEEQEKLEETSQLFPVSKIKQSDEQGFLEENILVLQNLIQEGNRRLDHNLKKADGRVVLILGNRGQAKTTLMEFLAQGQDQGQDLNSRQQHGHHRYRYRLIAKDGCWIHSSSHSSLNYFNSLWTTKTTTKTKLDSASSSTFGLPHFNLISERENTIDQSLLLYDYPDFHRPYPATSSEILAHYFKQRIIEQASHVKLLLTTPYSSIHRNIDKNWDFFNLLNEAAFVSRTLETEDGASGAISISMAVTMVPPIPVFELNDLCFNKSRNRNEDDAVLLEISNFLQKAKDYLEDEYEKNPEKYSVAHIQAAVKILDSLVSKHNVQFQRLGIGIFRLPNKNDIGPVQNLEYYEQSRNTLFEALLQNTEFTIKIKSEINNKENKTVFLSYAALSFLKKARPVLQTKMMKSTENVTNFIEKFHDSQILPCSHSFLIQVRKMRESLKKVEEKLKFLKTPQNLKDFSQNILQILKVPFPPTISAPFLIQGDILNYFYNNINNAGKFESEFILNITTRVKMEVDRVSSKLNQYEFNVVVEDSLSRIANIYSRHLDSSVPAIYDIYSYNRARALNESMSKLLETIESAREMGQVARGIFKVLTSLNISLAPENDPDFKFLNEISRDFTKPISNHQCQNSDGVEGRTLKNRWLEPIQMTRKVGECTLIWHEFIKETFDGISNRQYKFANVQTSELFEQVTKDNFQQFYQLLKKLQIPVSSSPLILKYCESAIFAKHSLFITSLNSMLNYTLKSPIECTHDESSEELTVKGHFVSLTSVINCQVLKQNPAQIQNLVILANQKIFLDVNVTRDEIFNKGNFNTVPNLIMISPEILVPKDVGVVHLNLDGKSGTSLNDGSMSSRNSLDGRPGENGGNILILTNQIENSENLHLSTNGGKGERGRNGSGGRPGINGIDANLTGVQHEEWNPRFYTYWSVIKSSKFFPAYSKHGRQFCKDPNGWYWPRTYSCQNWIFHGLNGSSGENGQDGGQGGIGGVKGHIAIFLNNGQNSLNLFNIANGSNSDHFGLITTANDGADGEGGLGGQGGLGGKNGNSIIATSSYWDRMPYSKIKTGLHFNRTEIVVLRAPSGGNGKPGKSGATVTSLSRSKLINEPFHMPILINHYRKFITKSNLDNHHATFYSTPSVEFLKKLEQIPMNSTFDDLFEEFKVLESKPKDLNSFDLFKPNVQTQLEFFYKSLLTRIKNQEQFERNHDNQGLKYLHLACLTKTLNYEDKNDRDGENVLNISSYLTGAVKNMEILRTSLYDSKTLVLLENNTAKFSTRIQSKLTKFSREIVNILEPRIEQIQNQVHGEIDNLLSKIQKLRRSKTETVTETRSSTLTNVTTDLEKQEKFSEFFHDMKHLTSSLNLVASAGFTAVALKSPSKNIRNSDQTFDSLVELQKLTKSSKHQLDKLKRFQEHLKTLASKLENVTSALEKHGVKSLAHAHQLVDKFMEQENLISMITSDSHTSEDVDANQIIDKSRLVILDVISEKLLIFSEIEIEIPVEKSESEIQNFVKLLHNTRNSLRIRFEMWEKYKNDQGKINELSLISEQRHRKSHTQNDHYLESRMKSLITRINSDLSLVSTSRHQKFQLPTFLDISQWEIGPRLKELSNYVQNGVKEMWNEFEMDDVVKECVGGLQKHFKTLSKIFHRIEIFQNQGKIAEFIKDIQSISLQRKSGHRIDLKDLESAITKNLVISEYNQAISAFKNWIFPFFHFFVEDFDSRHFEISMKSSSSIENIRLEILLENLKAGSAIWKKIETYLIPDIFENLPTSAPFYIWKHSEHAPSIAKLLKGESVLLTANIHESPEGKDAIKFSSIGLNFHGTAQNQSLDLSELLKHFKVSMSQIGNSYFRYGKKIYTSNPNFISDSTPLTFAFKTKTFSKEPAFFNKLYGSVLQNRAVLSPYSTWNISISPVVNDETSKYLREKLALFAHEEISKKINLELIGSGTCVATGALTEDELYLKDYYDVAHNKITIKTLWNENPLF